MTELKYMLSWYYTTLNILFISTMQMLHISTCICTQINLFFHHTKLPFFPQCSLLTAVFLPICQNSLKAPQFHAHFLLFLWGQFHCKSHNIRQALNGDLGLKLSCCQIWCKYTIHEQYCLSKSSSQSSDVPDSKMKNLIKNCLLMYHSGCCFYSSLTS